MKKHINFLFILVSIFLFSCDNYLEPITDSRLTDEQLMKNPAYLEGLLMKAYNALPNNYNNFNLDIASDDAVTNQQNSSITTMATGGWRSSVNPVSRWENGYEMIRHLNLFIEKVDDMVWAFDPRFTQDENKERNRFFLKRLKGEAYGMRAYYMAQLLQFHSGKSADGTILGFPIITSTLSINEDWRLPRNTFKECVQQIMQDLDTAINNLPAVYVDIPGDNNYNAASGAKYENRMNGNAAKACPNAKDQSINAVFQSNGFSIQSSIYQNFLRSQGSKMSNHLI